ncbi:hypothetical protein LJR290_006165 [Variovorax sp. LjRoot290]|uniref:hypothetical protein n=1 Tax=Variovorax sp. LjRoot290 TaxID=3342316 RepID=UPI003ECDF595
MQELNKTNLLWFIGYAIEKGLVNSNTGGSWKAAINKILEDVGPEDDLIAIDVPSEVLRFNNRHPGALSPDSLRQYQNRVANAIAEFAKYQSDPTKYKGVIGRPALPKALEALKKNNGKLPPLLPPLPELPPAEPPQHKLSAVTESSLMMPFPLRPNFLVQIIVPRDMTKDEAARLCTFIAALGHDQPVVN